MLDRLDTPAQVVDDLGRTLAQNELAVALNGDHSQYRGHERSIGFRWFTDPGERARYPRADHDHQGRVFASGLRAALSRTPEDAEAVELVAELRRRSPAFDAIWEDHDVGLRAGSPKRKIHPTVGPITLDCQTLAIEGGGQSLLVYTAAPGSESRDKLDLLRVVGDQRFAPSS